MFNVFHSSPTVTNCIFNGNSATLGGGMWNDQTSPRVINCTFSANFGGVQGGGGGMLNSGSGSPVASNCVFWNNSDFEIGGPVVVAVSYSNVEGGFPGTGNIDANPMFVDPDNGDYRLSPGSPCIDAGDNTAVPVGIDTDLGGNPRFVDDPDTVDTGVPGNGYDEVVDMGAYEFQLCPWDCQTMPDGNVNIPDFLKMLAQWGGPGSCDFDDGVVGFTDFLELLTRWGSCP